MACPEAINLNCIFELPPPNPGDASASDNCDPNPVITWGGDTDNGGTGCAGNAMVVTRTYTATDGCGNSSSCTQTITIEGTPLGADAGPNVTIYYGAPGYDCATLNATATGGCGPYTYAWSNGATTASTTVCPGERTCYTVTVTDVTGCQTTDEVCVCVIDVNCYSQTNNGHGGTGQAGNGQTQGNGIQHIYICHVPPASGAQTKCLPVSAMADHLSHGDYLGPCGVNTACPDGDGAGGNAPNRMAEAGTVAGSLAAFPNPFDATTTLRFSFNTDEHAILKVYDMSGRVIVKLFEGDIESGLVYTTEFKPESLSNGVFIARLETSEGGILTQNLVFIK
jgi:hypothetical protein